MIVDIPFVADWKQIGEFRQHQTDRSNKRENNTRVDYDQKVGDRILIHRDGILCKAESIMTVHTNGAITIQCGTKSERINT